MIGLRTSHQEGSCSQEQIGAEEDKEEMAGTHVYPESGHFDSAQSRSHTSSCRVSTIQLPTRRYQHQLTSLAEHRHSGLDPSVQMQPDGIKHFDVARPHGNVHQL